MPARARGDATRSARDACAAAPARARGVADKDDPRHTGGMTTTVPARRRVSVDPERLERWLDTFAQRHGTPQRTITATSVLLAAPDDAHAWLHLTWGPCADADAATLADYYGRQRRVGALIVRRKAHAVGVFEGAELVARRHDSHYVQGRTKAGGWSQQRYARRRQNQADRAFGAAMADVEEILSPQASRLDSIVTGGDAHAVQTVLGRPEFEALRALARRPTIAMPDPNHTVLLGFAKVFRAVPIDLDAAAQAGATA